MLQAVFHRRGRGICFWARLSYERSLYGVAGLFGRKAVGCWSKAVHVNLGGNVDEQLLYDTFSARGTMATTVKIVRDPSSGASRGHDFVSYTESG
ncbi:hypothetical protein BYT27DRAFT_6466633 [Phlegmacium glaucopus]|nr:hypothetical protein BYT27DRAFT_6466633 [Phlegmacium glaucopus]